MLRTQRFLAIGEVVRSPYLRTSRPIAAALNVKRPKRLFRLPSQQAVERRKLEKR